MKKIDSLFFELLQVSIGHLECLSRGPEPDEWVNCMRYQNNSMLKASAIKV